MREFSRRAFLAVGGGSVALAAVPRAWSGLVCGPARDETFLPWAELAEGVHASVDLALGGNAMVISSAGEGLLVDTKFPAFAAALAREGEALGSPITRVINTHHHGDHTGGNGVLNPGAEIIAHARAAERIAGQLETYVNAAKGGPRQVSQVGRDRAGLDAVLAEATAAAEASATWTAESVTPETAIESWPHEMAVGETKLVLHHFGAGHTDNDLVVQLPDLNILHTGDLCFHGLHPDFDPAGGSTCRGWSAAVARTIELCDPETVVLPGHGQVTDRAGLEQQKRYLDEIWDRVAKEIRQGKTKEDITAMSWEFMDGLGFEQVRARALSAVYDELRPAG